MPWDPSKINIQLLAVRLLLFSAQELSFEGVSSPFSFFSLEPGLFLKFDGKLLNCNYITFQTLPQKCKQFFLTHFLTFHVGPFPRSVNNLF